MRRYFTNKFHEIFENGEFIDEEETEILQNSFICMRLMHMSPKPGIKLTAFDLLIFMLITSPISLSCGVAECVVQYLCKLYLK